MANDDDADFVGALVTEVRVYV